MNISRALSHSSCLQIRRCFYSVSSSLIGPPPEGIGLTDNDHKIGDIYEKNKVVLGNNAHAVLKDTIRKYHILPFNKTIVATSEGLSDIENTIQNLAIKKSDKEVKKILEIEIHSIRQQFNCLLNILDTLQNQNNKEKD